MKKSIVITSASALVFLANLVCNPVQAMIEEENKTNIYSSAHYPTIEDFSALYEEANDFDNNLFVSKGTNWQRAAGVPSYATIVQAGILDSVLQEQNINSYGGRFTVYGISVQNNIPNQHNPVSYSVVEWNQ